MEWSVAACMKSKHIERTIVSTDSEDYAELAKSLGAEAPFIRPAEISTDSSTDVEFISHALNWLESNDELPVYVVHIRPTTPFRDPNLIDQAIDVFASSQATALRSVHPMAESAYKTFEISQAGELKRVGVDSTELDAANNARQHFPSTYIANGKVDVLCVEFIRKAGLLHGNHVMPFITPVVDELDVPEDFQRLEYQLSVNPAISSRIFGKE